MLLQLGAQVARSHRCLYTQYFYRNAIRNQALLRRYAPRSVPCPRLALTTQPFSSSPSDLSPSDNIPSSETPNKAPENGKESRKFRWSLPRSSKSDVKEAEAPAEPLTETATERKEKYSKRKDKKTRKKKETTKLSLEEAAARKKLRVSLFKARMALEQQTRHLTLDLGLSSTSKRRSNALAVDTRIQRAEKLLSLLRSFRDNASGATETDDAAKSKPRKAKTKKMASGDVDTIVSEIKKEGHHLTQEFTNATKGNRYSSDYLSEKLEKILSTNAILREFVSAHGDADDASNKKRSSRKSKERAATRATRRVNAKDASAAYITNPEEAEEDFVATKQHLERISGKKRLTRRRAKTEAKPKRSKKAEKITEGEDSQLPASSSKVDVQSVDSDTLHLHPVHVDQPPVPALSYGLDRVLFNRGVYQLQDPRSGVYNFDPYLAKLMPISEFDFSSLKRYITSSKDNTLVGLAAAEGKTYTGSTSSLSAILAHFHYLLSAWRPISAVGTTRSFQVESNNFTRILRAPAAAFLHNKDGTYAVDADKEFDTANILSMLGQSMEKLLTLPKEHFEKYRVSRSHELTEDEKEGPQPYNYSTLGDFLIRSQLDAKDDRLPGSGVFDLKTRAVISIRMDAAGFHKGVGYEIRQLHGDWESFEREYYDLVRSAFLKYSLQVRMGRMDGIFVAYHNTQRIFGFQYFPLSELDLALHGTDDVRLGDQEFKLSVHLLNKVFDKAREKFPGKSLRFHFETRTSTVQPFMYIFAKPVTQDEITEIQNANSKAIEEFERTILGLEPGPEESEMIEEDVDSEDVGRAAEDDEVMKTTEDHEASALSWEELRASVEDAIESEELGMGFVRETVEDALEQSGLVPEDCNDEHSKVYVDALMDVIMQSEPRPASTESGVIGNDATKPLEDLISKLADAGGNSPIKAEVSSLTEAEEGAIEPPEPDDNGEPVTPSQTDDQAESVSEPTPEKESLEDQETTKALEEQAAPDDGEDESKQLLEPDAEDTDSLDPEIVAEIESRAAALKALILLHSQRDGSISVDDDQLSKVRSFERILSKAIYRARSSPQSAASTATPHFHSPVTAAEDRDDDIFGMHLSIRNRVNDKYVTRPENFGEGSTWEVEYSIGEISQKQARAIYHQLLARRQKELEATDKDEEWYKMWRGKLAHYSKEGAEYRQWRNREEEGKDVQVYGEKKPRPFDRAFAPDYKPDP